ncbi:MAG TPA: 3-deoxy-manno-octulosonate cytidylyltransferase [Candidatus Scybalocola faecipullorum]|nr:3-deoxy-manno-octulosonate cytidylyltransferase [Candidatus Scybalocola faecipullorum]
MTVAGMIPARYASSRFPGKPLADISGRPMLWWVYQRCMASKLLNEVYVVTDDTRICEACRVYHMKSVMTSKAHQTGTDRIGEAAGRIPADIYVNIQGDEPMLEPHVIDKAIEPMLVDNKLQVTNLMTAIKNPVDVVNFTVPKVIVNKDNVGIYLTRSAAPYPKGSLDYSYYKQVCVYGFRPQALRFFCEYGKTFGKARMEAVEDIEILRFIENGYKVQYILVDSDTIAVDTPKDLEKVRKLIWDQEKVSEISRESSGGMESE